MKLKAQVSGQIKKCLQRGLRPPPPPQYGEQRFAVTMMTGHEII